MLSIGAKAEARKIADIDQGELDSETTYSSDCAPISPLPRSLLQAGVGRNPCLMPLSPSL